MHAKASRRGQKRAEVEAAGGGQGVDAVAISAFEIVATHQTTVFMIVDHGLDGDAMAHLATIGLEPADLAR